jgi:dTDP-glucose 4,6-dehydratase
MKTILVTGAAGFIGHHFCEHILKNTDWNIVVLDRLDYASMGYDRLRDIEVFDDKRVKIFTWDLCLPISENLEKEIGHIDYIVHMAAGSHVDDSITNPVPFIMNNVQNSLNMLEFARRIKPEKYVYFSTDEVYSTAPEGVEYKEGDRFNPGNPYSASKAAAECFCMAYANTYKMPIIITNTMNVLGERQHPQKYLPKIINTVLDGKILTIHANPQKTQAGKRHYIHARNVADALIFILNNIDETLHKIDASKGKFNIVGEREIDNLELAQLVTKSINKVTGKNYKLKYKFVDEHSLRPGHDLRYSLSGDKMKTLGWQPPKKIEETIDSIVAWSLKPKNLKWLGRNKI